MKVLTVVDPKIPISKMHHVGATVLPYDLCQVLASTPDVDMSILVHNDLGVQKLGEVSIVDLGEPKSRYQQQVYRKLKDMVDDYDLIHVHISTPGFVKYLVEFPQSVQKKIIYTMHTWTDSLAVSYFYKDYFYKLVTDSHVNIVFLTDKQKQALLKSVGCDKFYNESRISLIPNAVNIGTRDRRDDNGRAIAVGRMVESKGIDKIIRACIETNQKLTLVSPPWRVTPKEQRYRDMILDLIESAPEGLIRLSEGMPHDELMDEIHRSKMSILFSTFDVFSLFILESINLSTPVLAYDSGSTSEVCDILESCGVTRFKNYKDLVRILNEQDYSDVDLDKIPKICTYSHFVDTYCKLYHTITDSLD